ncbi:YkgJ family cysteine cluster protein [Bacteroidota bacterium]
MSKLDSLKKTILEQYPRLKADDKFQFACHPGVSCFNQCCSDVNIFLTPYDVLRLKNHLGIDSQEFIDKFTQLIADQNQPLPLVQLRMNDNDIKDCFFVDPEKGCTVYDNRPWSCRMYPVGQASPKESEEFKNEKFYFILHEDVCKGFEEGESWTITDWMKNQGVEEYDKFGEMFKEIAFHDFFKQGKVLTPQKVEMFFLACYNLDRFREFIFGTTFLKRFDVSKTTIDKIKNDDEELLKFGFEWLRFSLFGEKTIKIKDKDIKGKKV